MSDEGKTPESPKDALLSITSLDFGPAWARSTDEKKKGGGTEGKEKRRGDERRGEGRRDERRERRDDRREGKGRRFDNREGDRDRGDRGRRFNKGGRGRRDDNRGRPQREEAPPPEGVTAEVIPVEEGLDGLAKEILAGGRTYSVFDLAKLVLGARERFNVNFRSGGEGGLFRCKKDGALWLSKAEALHHFWRADWRKEYYEEVTREAEPPRGNFQAVARCGISGEWLGPPNYHGYQPAIAQLHRERFGHMSLDAYKRKIRMERGEEAVNAWLEKMSKRTSFRPTGGLKPDLPAEETAGDSTAEAGPDGDSTPGEREHSAEDEVAEAPVPAGGTVTAEEQGSEDSATESAGESDEEAGGTDDSTAEEEAPPVQGEETAPSGDEELLLADAREVERHFVEHHFEEAFQQTNRAWVSGNIPGNHLSPGLLTLLRHTVAEERRYPGKLTPRLCRQLSGRHVAVFKWRRKLKAGPSRPHPIPADITIADRPKSLLGWIAENSGRKLELLWKDLLPEKVSDQEKLGWYHDLHWLLNQGYVLLMADSTIHLAKKPGEGGDQPPASASRKKGGRAESPREGAPKRSEAAKAPEAPKGAESRSQPKSPPLDRPVSRVIPSGLYAIRGRTLSGIPKSPESLSGKGLWPLLSRFEEEPDHDEEEEEAEARW